MVTNNNLGNLFVYGSTGAETLGTPPMMPTMLNGGAGMTGTPPTAPAAPAQPQQWDPSLLSNSGPRSYGPVPPPPGMPGSGPNPLFVANAGAISADPVYQQYLSRGYSPEMAASISMQIKQATSYQTAQGQGANPFQAQMISAAPNALDFAGGVATPAPLSNEWLARMVGMAGGPGGMAMMAGGPSSYFRGDASSGMPSFVQAAAPVAGGSTNPFIEYLTQQGFFQQGSLPPSAPGAAPTGTTSTQLPQPFGGGTADQFLADSTNDLGYLRGIAENAGYPTDATSAWQAMVKAQERNQQKKFADLTAAFDVSGNRFSTSFGGAATDYWNQAGLDQNALLGQMIMATQEAARGRESTAAGQLGQIGAGAGSQLSSQSFLASQNDMMRQLQAALAMFGGGTQAASQLANLSAGAANTLNTGATTGATGLYGVETGAANSQAQLLTLLQQMGLGASTDLSRLWQSNLGVGSQLGGQQYSQQQDQINRMYQEWLRTQPQYNPLLPFMQQGSGLYPPQAYPTFQPSQLPGILGGAGGILGALSSLFGLFF